MGIAVEKYDLIIVGAGASGLCAAAEAAVTAEKYDRSLRIALLEKEKIAGKKILATGNGRCNFANRSVSDAFYCSGKDLVRAVMRDDFLRETTQFFSDIGIPYADDGSGRLYPMSRKASSVQTALLTEVRRLGVTLVTEHTVETILRRDGGFLIDGKYTCRKLILAVGSCAGLGNTQAFNGYALMQALHVRVKEPYPCLCGVLLDSRYPHSLKGVRQIARVAFSVDGKNVFSEKGEVQFNEKGISGIPVMQGSCYVSAALARRGQVRVLLDLLPDCGESMLTQTVFARAEKLNGFAAEHLFTGFLPKPLYFAALRQIGVAPSEPLPQNKRRLAQLAHAMKYAEYTVTATVGFDQAQVAGGGADCNALEPQTLAVKNGNGLYLCGEAADVVGLCGGYNLMWAWGSGRLAGRSAACAICMDDR